MLPVQERFDVPVDWMVVLSKLQARPSVDETARVTFPVYPLTGEMVMDDVPGFPAETVEGETSPAETVKSTTLTIPELV